MSRGQLADLIDLGAATIEMHRQDRRGSGGVMAA